MKGAIMAKNSWDYNKVIAYNEDEIYLLDYTFNYTDGFKGAVGTIVRPVTEGEYNERLSREGLAEMAECIWRADAGSTFGTELGLEEWIDENLEELRESAIELQDLEVLEAAGLHYFAAEIIGAGRVFHEGWDEGLTVVDRDLLEVINTIEGIA